MNVAKNKKGKKHTKAKAKVRQSGNDSKSVQNNKSNRGYATDSLLNMIGRLGDGTMNVASATEYTNTRLTQSYNFINTLYRSHWIVRKVIDCVPEDMIKNWVNITTQLEPEQLKRFDKLLGKTRIKRDILRALKWGRLYGGAGAVMIIDGQEDVLDEPLDYDLILPGSFKGLIVCDRHSGLNPSSEIIEDVSSPEFGLPEYYQWNLETGGTLKVHHSRILRFTGRELPFIESLTEIGWGASEIETIYDELKKRDNTSWNIAQLIFLANLRVLKMSDLGELLALGDEGAQTDLYNTLNMQNKLMNSMGLYVMDQKDGFETHQYSFGGVNDIYESFMLDVAGAAEIPVTRLFGRSPAGFNSTGESDMKSYYDMVCQKQVSQLEPALDKLFPVMCMSEFGYIPEDLDYKFNPIAEPSEEELADIVDKKSNSIINVFNSGLISPKIALKELKELGKTTGMFTNITDEDIAKADDDTDSMGDMPMDYGVDLNEEDS